MDINTLNDKIRQLALDESIYNLYGDNNCTAGAVSLQHINNLWRVFSCDERNNLLFSYWFDSESIACEFIYEQMISETQFDVYMKNHRRDAYNTSQK